MSKVAAHQVFLTAILLILGRAHDAFAQPECGYEVVIVHPSPCGQLGPPSASGRGLNSFGHIAGLHEKCSDQLNQAFLWTPQTGMVDLQMPEDTFISEAFDINDSGWSVGSLELFEDDLAFIGFLNDGKITITLGTLPGGNWSEALDINNAGQIAGYWGNFQIGTWQTFIWEDGVMTDLGPEIGGVSNRGLAMNEEAAITGWWRRQNGSDRLAFLWHDGVTTNLGPIPDGFSSEGKAINDNGDIAGKGKKFDEKLQEDVRHAFLWTDGEMIDLGVLPGRTESFAYGVNDAKQVVGLSWDFGSNSAPFIWQNGVMTDLNDLVPPEFTIASAWAINNEGMIAGAGNGAEGGFPGMALLIPIPRPVGDLNLDCEVSVEDLLILLGDWGLCNGCDADLDNDGAVGTSDLLLLLSNWG